MQQFLVLTKEKENFSSNKSGVLATEKDLEWQINTPRKTSFQISPSNRNRDFLSLKRVYLVTAKASVLSLWFWSDHHSKAFSGLLCRPPVTYMGLKSHQCSFSKAHILLTVTRSNPPGGLLTTRVTEHVKSLPDGPRFEI